jgi:hypothetical protein
MPRLFRIAAVGTTDLICHRNSSHRASLEASGGDNGPVIVVIVLLLARGRRAGLVAAEVQPERAPPPLAVARAPFLQEIGSRGAPLLSFQEPQTPQAAADNALTPWPAPPPELQGLLERTLRTMPPARPISCSVARRVTLRRSSLAHRLIHSDGQDGA